MISRSRAATFFLCVAAAAALVRCAGPDQCLRMSDCASGLTCMEGTCHSGGPDMSVPTEGGVVAPIVDATTEAAPKADSAAPPTDAATNADTGEVPDTGIPDDSTDF